MCGASYLSHVLKQCYFWPGFGYFTTNASQLSLHAAFVPLHHTVHHNIVYIASPRLPVRHKPGCFVLPVLPWWENWMICGRLSARGGVRTVTVQPHRQPQGSHTHTHTWRGDKGCHDDPLVTVATQLFVLTKRWFSPSGPRSPCVSIGSISLRVCIYLRSQRETSRMFQVSQLGFNASLHPFFFNPLFRLRLLYF